jgi:hypothetical protein
VSLSTMVAATQPPTTSKRWRRARRLAKSSGSTSSQLSFAIRPRATSRARRLAQRWHRP